MKQPIAWHKSCLEGMKRYLSEEEDRANAVARSVAKTREEVRLYGEQIAEAERRNLDGFDAERLLRQRNAS